MSARCYWFTGHVWGKWELIVYDVGFRHGDGIENWQRRRCERCGRYQERYVS